MRRADGQWYLVGLDVKTNKERRYHIGRMTGLTSGAHVKFFVTAVNSSGESVPSAVVELVVP